MLDFGIAKVTYLARIADWHPRVHVAGTEQGSDAGEVVQSLTDGSRVAVIGRDQLDGIEIFKDSIPRSHARIVDQDGFFCVRDLNSTNVTFVNGRRIEKHVLRDGNRIGIGGQILVFQ